MVFEYLGVKYTDEDMAVLKRFEQGGVIDYEKEDPSFYKLRNTHLIRGRATDGTDVHIDKDTMLIRLAPTTKATGAGKKALWRYEHPYLAQMKDAKEYVSDKITPLSEINALLMADAVLLFTIALLHSH